MNNPGIYDLGDRTITGAMSGEIITLNDDGDEFIENLGGMLSANVQIKFNYGAGGTSCKIYVQTSLDQGVSWIDVICDALTTTSETLVYNLSALTAKTTGYAPTDGSLSDDTSVDGILGDMWRVKIISTGTYTTNTSVSVRLNAR